MTFSNIFLEGTFLMNNPEAPLPTITPAAEFAEQHKAQIEQAMQDIMLIILKRVQALQREVLNTRKTSIKLCLSPTNIKHANPMTLKMWQIRLLTELNQENVDALFAKNLPGYEVEVQKDNSNGFAHVTISWSHLLEFPEIQKPRLRSVS